MAATPTTGNTLLPAPRLTGDNGADLLMLIRWLSNTFDQLTKVTNVTGSLANHEARISALEAEIAALQAKVG